MCSVFAGIAKTILVKDLFFLGEVIFKLSIKVANTSAWPRFFSASSILVASSGAA